MEETRSLHETIAAGFGGEITDQVVRAKSTRPLWLLKPLPLNRPTRGGPSLQSSCLAIISREFHHFRPSDLTLPSHLLRKVMMRVNSDRGYTATGTGSQGRPDEATMWAFIAVNDAEGAATFAPTHTISLPTDATLAQLPLSTTRTEDREHPIVELPRMFKSVNAGRYTLMTTLTLDGAAVDDRSVQALRWCTNLTALWMRNGRVTDDGVRMLSMTLDLPGAQEEEEGGEEGKGLWRLRALYISGCRGVSDRSMKSFARWPGLSVLDVRDTSCTEAAMGIVNRTSDTVFGGLQPKFQPCTDGLRQLFQQTYDPEEVLANLGLTLLKPDIPSSDDGERRHLSLHMVPGRIPAPEYLHNPPSALPKALLSSNGGHFVAGGTGTVWGKDARRVNDHELESKRHKVEWALNFESHNDAVARAQAQGKAAPKSWWEKEREEASRTRKEFWAGVKESRGSRAAGEVNHVAGRVFFSKKEKEKAEMEAQFGAPVAGMPDLMLVRMVHPKWEQMEYAHTRAQVGVEVPSTQVRKTGGTDVADMLISSLAAPVAPSQPSQGSQFPQHSQARSSSPVSEAPSQKRARPWASRPAPFSQPPPSQSSHGMRRNPFAAKPVERTSDGVRKLDAPPMPGPAPSSQARDPLAFLDKGDSKRNPLDSAELQRGPLAFVGKPKPTGGVEPTTASKLDPLAFLSPKSFVKPLAAAKSTSSSTLLSKSKVARPAPADKKRKAPAPAAPAPKRKLTDFFPPKS